ncbi:TonB-dependent receptor [Sphingosinicellaceae bacterium]|nr:TonB-dependent receptor [Sphingosinicellaceae bacterium]
MSRLATSGLKVAMLTTSAFWALPVVAQVAPDSTRTSAPTAAVGTPDDRPPQDDQSEIIVTGTSVARRALDTPLAVSTINADSLQRTSQINQADILNTIPTIKADGGGGEVAANVFVRGLPSGGQYQFTPLEYDGIPVLSTFGLNSSAFDVYYRNDLGLDRLEFVRGGVSNLFGPGSVAGLINYISRTGGDEMRGTAQLEIAERGRYKGDVAVSGPLGHGLYYALSGWYRTDDGPIRTGLDTKGYQVRGNLKYEFPDQSGSITVYGQYIDDQVQYYLPVPLDGKTRNRTAGNDGKKVYQVINNNVAGLGFNTPDGPFTTDITDGVTTKGGQIAVAFDKKFGDSGFAINGRGKYSRYAHKFGLWSDGDGIINVPETQASFLTNRGLGSTGNASFTYADDGTTLPGDNILFANRFTDRNRPTHDYTGELNLTLDAETGSVHHNFTLGGFYADATARDFNVTTTYLGEFNNKARLVDLTVTNPVTNLQTIYSRDGLLNAGAGYVNNRAEVKRYAAYFADQTRIGDRFNLDIGVRVEHLSGDISRERTSVTVTDATTPNLSPALRDVIWGNDGYLTGHVSSTQWAVAGGALYKVSDRVSLYVNGSRGYFFPEIRAVQFRPLPVGTAANASVSPGTNTYDGEIIKQFEGGIKVDQPWFNLTAAAFYTKLDNRRQINFINDGAGGFTEQVNLVATRSYGVEGTLDVKILDHLHFNGNLTLTNAKYTKFQQNGTVSVFVGKDLERQPDLLYNAGLYYDDDRFDLSISTNYTGDNFTAANNAIRLNGWNVVNLDTGIKMRVLGDRHVRLSLNIFNLLNTDAVTEGSPRQDINQAAGGDYFVGRPVLPRRLTGRLTFNF